MLGAGYDCADRVDPARDEFMQLFANLGLGRGRQSIRKDHHVGQSLLGSIGTVEDRPEWISNLMARHVDKVQRLSFGFRGFLDFHLLYLLCELQR